MSSYLARDLHELIFAMDTVSARVLARDYGTDHGRFVFLSPLAAGPLDMTRLATALNLTKAAVSKRVPGLVAEGWIETTEDRALGRRVVVSLTPKGRALVDGAGAALNRRFAAMLAALDIDVAAFGAQVATLLVAVRAMVEELSAGEVQS